MAVRKYVYDGDAVLQETDGAGATLTEYTRTGGGYGDLLSAYDGTSAKYYEPDALGSTDALADQAQAVADRWGYRAFGSATQTAGTDVTPFTWVGRQGYFADSDTGLYLLGSGTRFYDPATAQFLSRDPIQFASGDADLYRYVSNRAPSATDPSGLYQLTWQTEAEPRFDDCGQQKSAWRVTWLLAERFGRSKGGYIIQHMTITVKAQDCCGNRISAEDFLKGNNGHDYSAAFKGKDRVEYWEAWQMGDDEVTVVGHKDWDDEYSPATKSQEGVNVTITFQGSTRYYPTFKPNKTWTQPNKEALAEELLATIVPPTLPKEDVSNEIARMMTVHWNCCPKSASTKTDLVWSPHSAG